MPVSQDLVFFQNPDYQAVDCLCGLEYPVCIQRIMYILVELRMPALAAIGLVNATLLKKT